MATIIGIDLGTTNSCVSIIEGGDPVVIPNAEGSRTTPSVVAVSESGERLVGQIAKRQSITNPEHTIIAVKRLIGCAYGSKESEHVREMSAFEVVEHENGDSWVKLRDKEVSPAEVSSMILAYLKKTAEEYLGEEISEAVITVPAYFNDSQRQATKDAGRIAGLDVKRIINEPTAAALAYGLDREDKEGLIAVYDLGGGTFDVSILELTDGVFEVRSTNGDTHLGGEDFDQRIINYLADIFMEENQIDLRQNKMALQRLREAAEKAKHELSSSEETDINLPFIAANASGPKHLTTTISREKLEELVLDLVERTLEPCKLALKDAGVEISELSDVLLVGGMTRMPLIQRKISEFFDRETNKTINPDEVVGIGASIQGAVLSGAIKDVLLLDVTPLTLSVETAGGVATSMIARNTTIPAKKSTIFSTTVDNSPLVSVHVIQGERSMACDNKTLARFELVGIPPAPRGVPQIEVSFEIDANGIVSVGAKDLGTGKKQSVKITSSSGLSEEEIQRVIANAEEYAADDENKREVAELNGRAEALIYTTEKSVEEYGHILEQEDLDQIEVLLAELKEQLKGDDGDLIRDAISELESESHKFAEVMYAEASEDTDDDDDDDDDF